MNSSNDNDEDYEYVYSDSDKNEDPLEDTDASHQSDGWVGHGAAPANPAAPSPLTSEAIGIVGIVTLLDKHNHTVGMPGIATAHGPMAPMLAPLPPSNATRLIFFRQSPKHGKISPANKN